MLNKGLMKGLIIKLPDLEEPWPIYLVNKSSKITRGPKIDILNFAPVFMLHMDFELFDIESIFGSTSTFLDIYSSTSYPFEFT